MKRGISQTTSNTIAIARVLCILCVMYVHVPPYDAGVPRALFSTDAVIRVVREMLGRSSVPLLSIVSGYLVARTALGGPFRATLGKKVMTLLVPLILWNVIALGKDAVLSLGADLPDPAMLPRLILAVDARPRLTPLYFLRDIFLCSLAVPILVAGLRTVPFLLMAALLINMLWNLDGQIILSSSIPLFYTLGLGLGLGRWQVPAVLIQRPRPMLAIGALTLSALALAPMVFPNHAFIWTTRPWASSLLILQRSAGAVTFWLCASAIARHPWASTVFRRLEPGIFFVFCCHPLVIGLLWLLLRPVTAHGGDGAVLAAFLITPFVVLAIAIAAIGVMRKITPRLLKVLMAGRVISDRQIEGLARPFPPLLNRPAKV